MNITRTRSYRVECEGCDHLHPLATRARARIHVRHSGHTVRYIVEETTRYEPTTGENAL